jgi:hypothetical protein
MVLPLTSFRLLRVRFGFVSVSIIEGVVFLGLPTGLRTRVCETGRASGIGGGRATFGEDDGSSESSFGEDDDMSIEVWLRWVDDAVYWGIVGG